MGERKSATQSAADMEAERAAAAAQEREIAAQVRARPLVGATVENVGESLRADLAGNDAFLRKLPSLQARFAGIRRVRGDGNCFYRSFMFRLLELARTDAALRARLLDVAHGALRALTAVGYEEMSIETFCEYCVDTLEGLGGKSAADLEALFGDEGESDYLVWFGRLACAGQLKQHAERFLPFLDGNWPDVASFCGAEVEPMGKEADEPQVIALSEFMRVRVGVAYINSSASDEATVHEFGPHGGDVLVHLLYRPGHYDILYKAE